MATRDCYRRAGAAEEYDQRQSTNFFHKHSSHAYFNYEAAPTKPSLLSRDPGLPLQTSLPFCVSLPYKEDVIISRTAIGDHGGPGGTVAVDFNQSLDRRAATDRTEKRFS